ncbi:MAG TPA: CaiB/BaiF CoA-transferase family protein [Anaeromyxobacter sp.]|nr:CaiB/BaiF CoA-transferase family protein [Anaeromyxobacter sp.]
MTSPSTRGTPGGPLPLSGVRVVEFSHMVMGPSCGLILADLGADVVKVEPVGRGDGTRRLPGSGAGFFPAYNRNKRSLALDVTKPRGLALARRLIDRADVLIENFRPGAFDALGLGWEAVRATNPRLVYCALKGFLAGPYEGRTALDEVVQMMGGLAYMTGPPGRPLRAGAPVNDVMGGMFAAIAILAALLERARTGEGQLVRSGLFENVAWLVSPHMAQLAVTGKAPEPMPARTSAWAIYDVFEAADGRQIFVAVVSDAQWPRFCRAFHLPELLADARLATNAERVAARERFLPRVRAALRRLGCDEIARTCEGAGLPFAPIQRPDELFRDPHLACPGATVEHTLEDGAKLSLPALPVELGGCRLGRRLDLPRVGEHTAEIAAELGYGGAEVEALANEGVVGVDRARSATSPSPQPATPPTRTPRDP